MIPLNENPLFDLVIYPNPTSGNIAVETSQKNVDLKIHNALGKLVFSKKGVRSQKLYLNDYELL